MVGRHPGTMSTTIATRILRQETLTSAELFLLENGVLKVVVTEKFSMSLEQVIALVEGLERFAEGVSYPTLIVSDRLTTPTPEARSYMAGEGRTYFTMADAFLIRSLPQRLIGNFYLRFDRPPVPTRLFTDEQAALKWLENVRVLADHSTDSARPSQ